VRPPKGDATKYSLSLYSRTSDALLAEVDISHVGPEKLASIFEQGLETFVESYPVGPKEAAALAEFPDIEIDLSAGEYFVEVFGDEGD
jgi:hypothetical protein